MVEFPEPFRKKVTSILSQITLVVDSSAVIDLYEQGFWYSLQGSVPKLATTDITVGEWERNVPVSSNERECVITWGENLTIMPDSTSTPSLQELPTLELSCGVKVYPTGFLKKNTTHSMSIEDYSQIWLAQSLEDSGEASALLSSNHSQTKKSPTQVWDYKFTLSFLSAIGSISSGDTKIEEMIKKDRDWNSIFDYQQYLTENFPIKVDRIYKELKKGTSKCREQSLPKHQKE